jgi:hypothetical protein
MASIRLVSDRYLIAFHPLKILGSGIWPAWPDNQVRGQNFSDRFCGLMCWMGVPKEKFVPPTGGLLVGFMLGPPALGWNFFFEKKFWFPIWLPYPQWIWLQFFVLRLD